MFLRRALVLDLNIGLKLPKPIFLRRALVLDLTYFCSQALVLDLNIALMRILAEGRW